jgi:hypothetical protein
MSDPSPMTPEPKLPTWSELLDRAVLTDTQRRELAMLAALDPIAAGIKIGGIIAGQQLACRMAADED